MKKMNRVMCKVMKSFICRGCSNPVTSTGRTSVDIGARGNLEVLDKFYYLGDMLSVDGDADTAVEARIRVGSNKFWQLVPLLTNRDILLIRRGGCIAVVCKVVCYAEVRPGLSGKKMRWHFSEQR